MQASSVSCSFCWFPGLCFRQLPKCLLAPNVCILKSIFYPASCSVLDRESLKWTSAISFVLSNCMCLWMFMGCQGVLWPEMCHQQPCWDCKRASEEVFRCSHPVSSVSSRMTHGDSSTPTHFSKLWATCCVLGMACTPQWAWQTCGWPSSAWLWVLLATPCLWATPLR